MPLLKQEVAGYNLAEFVRLAEELIGKGWKFDFDTNAHFPTSFGSFFSATMVKNEDEIKEEVKEVVQPENTQEPQPEPASRGRKKAT